MNDLSSTSPDMSEELVERVATALNTGFLKSLGLGAFEAKVIAEELLSAILPDIERQALERAAKVARQYAERPLGDSGNNTREAFDNGMDYSTGSADTASIIALCIEALIPQPEERAK